jgi:NhaP-type Na+/H+ or K+/H+ antiporter
MAFSCPMNRFERGLFWTALGLAAVILAVRIGAVLLMWHWHHIR